MMSSCISACCTPGLSVLAALVVCVATCVCILWCLECTWCCLCVGYMYSGVLGVHLVQEGSGLVKFQTFPISYGVAGHICVLWDMYPLIRDKVKSV